MRVRAIASAAAVALVVAGCGNSTGGKASDTTAKEESTTTAKGASSTQVATVNAPGVTDSEIHVSGVASITNPLGGKYNTAADGVNAYFAMVNSEGGVNGRQLVLDGVRDDKLASNSAEVKGLIDDNKSFAAIPMASLLFTGADQLVQSKIPTFGWTINPEWQGTADNQKLNLFGQTGSYLCLGCEQVVPAYVSKLTGRKKVGLLAYNVPQSTQCLQSWDKSIERWGKDAGAKVVFRDASLSYGTTDLSVQVQKMKENGVDFVATCMDNNGVITLAKEMKKQGVDAIQILPNGYDQSFLDEYGDLFEGSYVITDFSPLETPSKLRPDGLEKYEKWIEKTGGEKTENSIVGWLNADLLVAALEKAGPQFDQQKVVDAVNSITDYKADGMIAGVDWAKHGHSSRSNLACSAYLKVQDSKFIPITDKGVFTCFDLTSDKLTPSYK